MKKFGVLFLCLILVLSFAACGRRNKNQETQPTVNTTVPTTMPETMPMIPEMDPTLGTNIPDPNVDSTMPGMDNGMDGFDGADSTGTTDGENSQNPEAGANYGMRRGHR